MASAKKQGKALDQFFGLPICESIFNHYCVNTLEHQKNPFQSKQSKHFHERNRFS